MWEVNSPQIRLYVNNFNRESQVISRGKRPRAPFISEALQFTMNLGVLFLEAMEFSMFGLFLELEFLTFSPYYGCTVRLILNKMAKVALTAHNIIWTFIV